MVSLLIDFKKIIDTKNHSFLLEYLEQVPKSKFDIGLILIVPKKQLDILGKLGLGKQKIEYLNNKSFVKSILSHTYVIFNETICEIVYPIHSFVGVVIQSIFTELQDVTKILVGIPIKEVKTIEKYADEYFGNPHICTKSINSKKEYKHKTLCLVRDKHDTKNSLNDINYVLKQSKNVDYCMILASLSKETIKYLKNLCETGFTNNKDGGKTQKEVAGNMYARKIDSKSNHIIEVNKQSMIHGNEFGVDIVDGLYNFHSHPRNAYEHYNVKLGWPSAQDYIGFLLALMEDDTVFHLVITLEGIYIMSLSKEWSIDKDKLDKKTVKFIEKEYNFCYKEGNTIQWYLHNVNRIKYKKHQLFKVQFLYWKNASDSFSLPYAKTNDNCFSCTETKKLYDKLYF
jgi:hypothetical protein